MFAKELIDSIENKFPSKDEIAKMFVRTAQRLFPNTKLIVVVDGLYSSINFLKWCVSQKICLEARMHSHRVVKYRGKKMKIKDLLNMNYVRPKGRKMARTVSVIWNDMPQQAIRRLKTKNVNFLINRFDRFHKGFSYIHA